MNNQNDDARKLLDIIERRLFDELPNLTYKGAAEQLGRDPKKNSRAMGSVCNLLDAAAAYAAIPLLALVKVRNSSGEINAKAWTETEINLAHREAIINCSLSYKFSHGDFVAIRQALKSLEGKGNRLAWKHVRAAFSDEVFFRRIILPANQISFDAINDIPVESPEPQAVIGIRYYRDPKIREAVLNRAGGLCEYCNLPGFRDKQGNSYLESHHIIARAHDGADRMDNVIALCANHHREAHFGERRSELEKQMIQIVAKLGPPTS